jgi:hypothetical protein
MTREVSSAEPDKLFGYADAATRIGDDLKSESFHLGDRLRQFEQDCTEPGYRVQVNYLSQALADYGGRDVKENADWVRDVGTAFRVADWWWSGWGLLPSVPFSWSPVLLALPGLTAVTVLPILRVPDWLRGAIDSFAGSRQGLRSEPEPPLRLTPREWTKKTVRQWVKYDQGRLPDDQGSEQCVAWAKTRRKSLGGTPLPAIGSYSPPADDVGARQYLEIFRGETVLLSVDETLGDLTQIRELQPGTAVVWDRNHQDTKGTDGHTYGHIAVIEAVEPDCIWVSQANWRGKSVMQISREKLLSLHFIPPGAQSLSVDDFKRGLQSI